MHMDARWASPERLRLHLLWQRQEDASYKNQKRWVTMWGMFHFYHSNEPLCHRHFSARLLTSALPSDSSQSFRTDYSTCHSHRDHEQQPHRWWNQSHHRCCRHRPALCRHLHGASVFNPLKNHSFVQLLHKTSTTKQTLQQLKQKCWETWTSWWFLGTGTRRRRWTHPDGLKLMCPWCVCCCVSVIIYSHRLMLTAFARGPSP